jgi:ABC-2 type transport system permease protein
MDSRSLRHRIAHFLRAAYGRAFPRIWGLSREPSWIFFDVLVPLLNTTAFVYLYRTMHAPESYVGFVVLGATLSAYWLNCVWMMGTQLHWDKREGLLELYVLAPVSMMALLCGMAVGGFYQATLRAVSIVLVLSLAFGVHFDLTQWPLELAIFGIMMVALYGLGMVLSSVFLMWGREAWQLALALHEPAFFLTGLNFPLSKLLGSLPGFFTFISAIIPISFGLDALRQLMFPAQIAGVLSPTKEMLVLCGLAVFFIALAIFALRRMEWLARVEARLSLRWQ